jgi:hypothetical protein
VRAVPATVPEALKRAAARLVLRQGVPAKTYPWPTHHDPPDPKKFRPIPLEKKEEVRPYFDNACIHLVNKSRTSMFLVSYKFEIGSRIHSHAPVGQRKWAPTHGNS